MTRDEVLTLDVRQLKRQLAARCIFDEREGLDMVAGRFGLIVDKEEGGNRWKVSHPTRAEAAFTSIDLTEAVIRAAAVMMDEQPESVAPA